jgi:hypothetical protein
MATGLLNSQRSYGSCRERTTCLRPGQYMDASCCLMISLVSKLLQPLQPFRGHGPNNTQLLGYMLVLTKNCFILFLSLAWPFSPSETLLHKIHVPPPLPLPDRPPDLVTQIPRPTNTDPHRPNYPFFTFPPNQRLHTRPAWKHLHR